ncbi:tetratricopeptide repeat protein [Streptomyces sp. 6N223]|uniref:tetratricopeptide repeat protein n=1 Tax=Streptomyces sp. 6N223 TaxID=3457412 RepID=UPI003FD2B82E
MSGSFAAGAVGQLHLHQYAARVTWPHQVGVIPPRAGSFQDRAEAARLRQTLAGGGTAVIESADAAPGGVLTGMGGVGKSQLAADYARAALRGGEVDLLVWITAASASAVVSGLAQAGVEVLGADPARPEVAARAFLAWLEPKLTQRPCRWLVVLDDVSDPADVHGWWPPVSPHGRTVVTTRRKDAALVGGGRRLIEVGLFTPDQTLAYLTRALALHGRTEPPEELAGLADELGHLPLALSQAAAYLTDTGLGCAAYRALLADRTHALDDAAPDVLPDGQTHTTAAALALSLDHADTLRPAGLARPFLHLAAFFDPNGIPDTVLTSPPALAYAGDEVTADQAVLALRALYRLSLIDHDPDTPHQAVRVHQLIQRAIRDTLTPDQRHHLARTAADALFVVWPEIERNTALARSLRANTTALTDNAGDALYQPDAHAVLDRTGNSLGESGQVAAAHDHFHHLTITTTRHLGPDHLHTLRARYNLARWRGEAGDAAGAAVVLAEVLEDSVRVLGPDHPNTLSTRARLAYLRGETGDAAGAAVVLAEVLEDSVRVLGPDHPNTLSTRQGLAHLRGVAGDAAGAAVVLAEVLEDSVRVLGPDHPDTLATRHNLARWRGEAGDAAGAAVVLAEVLKDEVRVLGPDHPNTLSSRHNFAVFQGVAGDAAGAAVVLAEVLEDRMRVLGPDHPDTLRAREGLAYWRDQAGETGAT